MSDVELIREAAAKLGIEVTHDHWLKFGCEYVPFPGDTADLHEQLAYVGYIAARGFDNFQRRKQFVRRTITRAERNQSQNLARAALQELLR